MSLFAQFPVARGALQLLLALVFVASYALVLGRLAGVRGRLAATASGALAAVGLAALSQSREAGVLLVAAVPVGMALFAAAAWLLWRLMTWRDRRRAPQIPEPPLQRASPPPAADRPASTPRRRPAH
jgi:hypothetical protein